MKKRETEDFVRDIRDSINVPRLKVLISKVIEDL